MVHIRVIIFYLQNDLTISLPKEKDVITVLKVRLPFPVSLGIIFISLFFSSISFAEPSRYHLDISFLPEKQTLLGKATIRIPSGKKWQLYTGGLEIQEVLLEEEGKEPFCLPLPREGHIGMYASDSNLKVTLTYSLTVPTNAAANLISPSGIVLTSNWHPLPQENMLFSLAATLPQGFQGISESDNLPKQTADGIMTSSFSQPVRAIHLAAGPYQVEKETIREGLILSTWFFNEDQQLSRGYLDAAKAYILRYEKEIGPFPYNHYAIVSNRLPSGFGMPTFTLLGQMVLRLPFIKETSLGHEVLHSWFGNSIEVADGSGNWCEGLTSYLADYSYAADKGEGVSHRKATLINYQSYVHPDSAIPLLDFGSSSHNQPMAKAKRAVGYNRSSMLFHQLRGLLGSEHFFQGLRLFADSFKGRPASWQDIQTVFETTSGENLAHFFNQQLTRKDVPTLKIKNIRTANKQDSSTLNFTISQDNQKPYTLMVPIRVTTMGGTQNFIKEITEQDTVINITLSEPPLSFTIDPEYNLFRTLTVAELPPVWSRFMGAEHKLIIADKDKTSTSLAPFIKWAEQKGWTVVDDELVSNQQLSENSTLFLGANSAAFRSLYGKAPLTQDGFHLTVQNNPLNEKEVSVLVGGHSAEETKAALYKLNHYGKYSSLIFQKGRIQEKKIAASSNGLEYLLEILPKGGSTAAINSFDQIITELAEKRVIYIGETHDSLADHRLQLKIIQGLRRKGLDLAIGMEMFPASSQQALDDYLLKQTIMDEAEFLRASHWFDVWRYDWRLFRPTFTFCRQNKIPVYGINVDRKIVSTVFSDGNTDTLSPEQLETIAPERDLALDGYVERLRQVHGFHTKSPHEKNKGISGFVQSQAIWDESMAENIAKILQENPEKTVVVIAGSQHTRKDSGIPPRLARRINVAQASVLNIYANNPPIDPSIQADYFFLSEAIFLKAKGKIGIGLIPEKDADDKEHLKISSLSHAGKAKQAGIKENDIIVTINGQAAKNMEDIGILMMDSRAGDVLKITVLRKDNTGKLQEKEISVELSNLTKPPMHP
jgi:aminopeptidase N